MQKCKRILDQISLQDMSFSLCQSIFHVLLCFSALLTIFYLKDWPKGSLTLPLHNPQLVLYHKPRGIITSRCQCLPIFLTVNILIKSESWLAVVFLCLALLFACSNIYFSNSSREDSRKSSCSSSQLLFILPCSISNSSKVVICKL